MALAAVNPYGTYAGSKLPSTQPVLTQPTQSAMAAPMSAAPAPMTTSSDDTTTDETQEDTSQDDSMTGSGSQVTNVFVELMLAQLQYQDPTNPVDSSEFVTQLAMFAQVESMEYMRLTMNALYAVAENNLVVSTEQLIGNEVTAPDDMITLGPDALVEGELVLDKDYDNVTIRIYDEFDAEVATVTLGSQTAGEVAFALDGNELGLPEGEYRIEAETVIGDEISTTPTYFSGIVTSVSLKGQEGLTLNVEGIGMVPLFNITKISAPPGATTPDNPTEETPL
ncbi:flagellar hook assembly protein FlgD [Aeromonas aquatica]|uniref:flagellar hook assembly protein FlgD n=1 Tax=Aeromonas aquatica TaxID=558964 RepID=UPI00286F0035|nr:flagellar hook capping FlgD N-terminal domain-containing protein [Aeromonas aquatica]